MPRPWNEIPEVRAIVESECVYVTPDEVLGRGRTARVAITRGRCMARVYLHSRLGLSLTEVGAIFGGRDHTTVLHAVQKHARASDRDEVVEDAEGIPV